MSAPIVLTVYDRYAKFVQCVSSLLNNPESSNTILYVCSDGPLDDRASSSVNKIREYSKRIKGFKGVEIFSPNSNTNGAVVRKVIDEIKSSHSKYIVTEDDNVFSPFALSFLNRALVTYKDNPKVFSVTAYNYPNFPVSSDGQIYFRHFMGYGVGLWGEKDFMTATFDQRELASKVFEDKNLFEKINSYFPDLIPMIDAVANSNLIAADVCYSIYQIKNNLLTISPSMSLVRNTGFDGTGVHCPVNSEYQLQKISEKPILIDELLQPSICPQVGRWIFKTNGGSIRKLQNKNIFLERQPLTIQHSIERSLLKLAIFILRGFQYVRRVVWRARPRLI